MTSNNIASLDATQTEEYRAFVAKAIAEGELVHATDARGYPVEFRVLKEANPFCQAVCSFSPEITYVLLFYPSVNLASISHEISHALDWMECILKVEGKEDRADLQGMWQEELLVKLLERGWSYAPKQVGLFHIGCEVAITPPGDEWQPPVSPRFYVGQWNQPSGIVSEYLFVTEADLGDWIADEPESRRITYTVALPHMDGFEVSCMYVGGRRHPIPTFYRILSQ